VNLVATTIAGCHRVELRRLDDARGHFTTIFEREAFRSVDAGFAIERVNRSLTRLKGAIRGVHFQRAPMSEEKLVQCLRGSIFDVCVDLRRESPTYGQWIAVELSAESQEMLLVPKGCGHAFQTLTEDAVVEYFVTGKYSPEHEWGVRWNDPAIGIEWPLPCTMTSKRDAEWPLLER
jgi:dTDP-4-dehydrorhamnose 3,5-epimerase